MLPVPATHIDSTHRLFFYSNTKHWWAPPCSLLLSRSLPTILLPTQVQVASLRTAMSPWCGNSVRKPACGLPTVDLAR